ncbi:hypothetical protein pb186bvf_003717 [Paramecium bursaria]
MDQDEDVDVAALLASINANFEAEQAMTPMPQNTQIQDSNENQNEIPQSQIYQNVSEIILINDAPVKKEEQMDPIIEIVNRIEIQDSLLTNKDIREHKFDSTSLQETAQFIKDVFDRKLDLIYKNQKQIFQYIAEIRNFSTQLNNHQQSKEGFRKLSTKDINKKFNEITQLEIQTQKSKGYIGFIGIEIRQNN